MPAVFHTRSNFLVSDVLVVAGGVLKEHRVVAEFAVGSVVVVGAGWGSGGEAGDSSDSERLLHF